MILSLDSMETQESLIDILRSSLPLLQNLWRNVVLEEVNGSDHFYTDGASVGSSFKLVFYRSISNDIIRYITTVYIFPDEKWYSTIKILEVTEAIKAWVKAVKESSKV